MTAERTASIELTAEESALVPAFDGAFATYASLGRNSGLRGNALADAIEGLKEKGLCRDSRPRLFHGVDLKGFNLTAEGEALKAMLLS